ncbi:diguanylate cyclase [Jiella sp. MQZ9-1]|nr:diguanylate cyclase [Jiella flava]
MLDDDALFLKFLAARLWQVAQFDVVECSTDTELTDAVANGDVDCVLLDYDLGLNNGIAVSERLRSFHANPPPIILITGGGSERTAVKAFRSGFADYCSKRNLNIQELVTSIREAIARRREERAQSEQVLELKRMLEIDEETGLHSTRYISRSLDELTSARGGAEFAVALVELSNLPEIVRLVGHAMANTVMHTLAGRIKQSLRGTDVAGRYDTNTMILLLKDARSQSEVEADGRQLAEILASPVKIGRSTIHPRTIVGAALYPQVAETPDEIVFACREAIEEAQREGAVCALARKSERPVEAAADSIKPVSVAPPAASEDGVQLNVSVAPPAAPAMAAGAAASEPQAADADLAAERRGERRQRVLKRAKVMVPERGYLVDCVVRNLSPNGARLRFDAYFAPPEKFVLEIIGTGERRNAELRWQIGNEIGVELV